ncbi:MAG: ERCC4 domain-containing protein [Lachnospiraceae bacterium]|nr:ERCC4 domain-containing protein [Lachnospiraceae bacterium]
MQIQIDSREKAKAIKKILSEFDNQKIQYYVSKLYVGDYMNLDNPRVVVDRKQNLTEVCANVCQDHERFRAELIRAQEASIKVYVLVEHGKDISCMEDVIWWQNPRLKKSPKAITGERLYKILQTLERKYKCKFLFCNKDQTGRMIVEILSDDTRRN